MGKKDKAHAPDAAASKVSGKAGKKRRAESEAAAAEDDDAPAAAPKVRLSVADSAPRACACEAARAGLLLVVTHTSSPGRGAPQTVLELFTTRIKESSAYFDRLVALIPAKFYLTPSAEEEERNVRVACVSARHSAVAAVSLCGPPGRLHLAWLSHACG